MGNPNKIPPERMAPLFGIGKLSRHMFICLGPDCCDTKQQGEVVWNYLKKRLTELGITGADGPIYRTKVGCLRICIDGPIAVVYPEGTWYRHVTVEACERIIQEHLIGGKIVQELCFARDDLHHKQSPPMP